MTGLLREGRNAVGVWLGNGWYSSDRPAALRPDPLAEPYGEAPRAIVQLVIETAGGDRRTVTSDTTWVAVPVAGSARPVIREGDRVVWRGGALLPGAAGIGAASADPDYVTFDVGSANTGSGLPRNEKPHEISESERTIDTMSNLYEEEHHG